MKLGVSLFACGCAALIGACPAVAKTASVSWQGEWRLNVAESRYPAGFPPIHDHTTVVERDDGTALKYTDSFTVGDQPRTQVSFDGAYDGKPYKTSDGQMMAFRHTARGYRDSWTSAAGVKGKDACDFSPDGKTLKCRGSFAPPGGKTTSFTEVWNKVE